MEIRIIHGMRVWFKHGCIEPGVYAAPMAVKNVPRASKIPMIKKRPFDNALISGVTTFVKHIRGYKMAPPYTMYKKLTPWLTKKAYRSP